MENYSEYTQALMLYFSQALGAFILTIILWRSYRVYKHIYLKSWSFSWLAFGLYLTGASFSYLNVASTPINSVPRLTITFIMLVFGYMQLVYLIKGTFEIATKRHVSRKILISSFFLIFVAAIIFTTSQTDISQTMERLLVRVGFRAIVSGLCFVISAIMILKSPMVFRGLGVKLVFWTFLLYGLEQFNYFVAILLGFYGNFKMFEVTAYLGSIDLLLQSFMGIGMVVWLLEDESRELQKTNKELDSLVYSTSHDLRAPLASILGLLNVAKFEKNPENIPEYLKMMENRIVKLDNIIGDIMVFSQDHKVAVVKEMVNLTSLTKEIIEDFKFTEGVHEIKVSMNLENIEFFSDPNRLKIILSNLISNAIKYKNGENPFIKITAHKIKEKVIISIEDNGIGIEENQLDKIFDMFYRASNSSTGSGLGLYIVKEAAERLGGKVLVSSVPKKGSKFTLEFKQ